MVGRPRPTTRFDTGLAAARSCGFLIKTVTVATITSNLRLSAAPGNVLLAAGTAGLDRDCVVNVSQVVTLDKTTLETRLGILDSMHMQEVDAGLRLALSL